jgi:hypothetical protein
MKMHAEGVVSKSHAVLMLDDVCVDQARASAMFIMGKGPRI